MIQILKMAFRDLGRNRRRSFFSALAVGGGLALLILMASVIEGEMGGALENTIRLQSGHIQIRAATYDENKSSLKWEDLVANPDEIAAKIAAFEQVEAATPRLYASGFLSSGTQSAGAKITGIDPLSSANDPYRKGIISGEYLSPDDRDSVLIGRPMAEKLNLEVGDPVGLSINVPGANPARSNASQLVSRSRRCCGSIPTASRGAMPKKSGSKPSTASTKAASRMYILPGAGRCGAPASPRCARPSRPAWR